MSNRSNSSNRCLSCNYPYKPEYGPCPNCGQTTGQTVKQILKRTFFWIVMTLLLALLWTLLSALGLLPEK